MLSLRHLSDDQVVVSNRSWTERLELRGEVKEEMLIWES